MTADDRESLERRVLVLAPTGKDAELTRAMLGRAGVECVCCTSLEQVCEQLAAGAGAVLLVEEAVVPGRDDSLARWLAGQPPWSDLPVLVLARSGADSEVVAQSMDLLGNVTVLERPMRVAALVSAARTALRARQRQYQIRDHLAERERGVQTQSLLAAIVASSGDAIISKTLDGTILTWNVGAERLFGYTAAEAVGRSITMLIPPDRQHEEPAILERLRRGERIEHFETVRVTRDGRHLDISLTVSPVRDADGRIFAASKVARDITQAKRAAEALRESRDRLESELTDTKLLQGISAEIIHQENIEALYEKIMDAAAAVMHSDYASMQMLYPERGAGGELRLLAFRGFNPQAAKFWGWVRADSESTCGAALRTGRRAIAPDIEKCDYMAGTEDLATYRQTGIRACQTTPLVSRGGKLVGMLSTHWNKPHDPSERDLSLLDILARQAADLIERNAAEEALRESEWQMRLITDATPGLIAYIDATLHYRFVNRQYELWFSRPRDEVIGRPAVDVLGPEAMARLKPHMDRALRGEEDHFEDEIPYRTGGTRWIDAQYVPHVAAGGSVRGFFVLVVDISDRKRAEQERERLVGELKEADRRKDEFIATLAHELRNPLAPIRNSLHILRLSSDHDPASRRVGEMIERQVNHMVRLVDDLLEVSRITRGKIELRNESVEVAALVRGAVETSRPLVEAGGHRLALAIPPEPLTVDGDPVRLTQVIANLLNNAAKYTPDGGQIWLAVRREGGRVAVSVRDTGVGIPPEMLGRVFEPFMQVDRHADRAQGGLGIGLTLVKSLVELHGGTVQARSDGPGRGSEFVVRLPLAARHLAETPAEPAAQRAGPSAVLASRRVLVVDDNRDAADSLGTLLSLLGADVHVVYSGPEALEALPEFRPAAILLDIGMPGMDGLQVAARIRQQPEFRDVKLVALTGWGQEEDRRRTQGVGFDCHLIKPADVNILETVLASLDGHPDRPRYGPL